VNRRAIVLLTAGFIVAVATAAFAQRELTYKQVDEPHPYYWREMYLPQLTTGPGAVAWMQDAKTVVYSMAGSLWRQAIDSMRADQLTAGPGYDYQPDVSPDGRWLIYTTYHNDALELYALEIASGKASQLTSGGAVNVEPRFSPDGKRIAFVSTSYNGRFHIFTADFTDGKISNVQRLTGEERTTLPRYYYSAFDHEISPAWSPDGKEIIYISNRGHLYGTGGIWRMKATPGAERREIFSEETTWRARPDLSPDGKRVVFSSYAGRNWHQLWVLPAEGGAAFPITYGEYDNTAPRWSPDGKQIAFISNRGGNTSLWVEEIPGGAQRQIVAKEKKYSRAMVRVHITVLDEFGKPTAARVSVTGAEGRAYAPDHAWMHAADGFTRGERPFEPHYFHMRGTAEVVVPAGKVEVEVMKGFEYQVEHVSTEIGSGKPAPLVVGLNPLRLPATPGWRWVSGDLHIHMNYAGTYRNTPKNLIAQAEAEDLNVVNSLIVNKEQRMPDIAYFTGKLDAASTATTLLWHGQEFHTSSAGHLALLHLQKNILLPDYADYPQTAAASLFPSNSTMLDMAHAQGGVAGYVHLFDEMPDPAKDAKLTHWLPADVALGKVDYIEVLGFADHRATASVWYRLLNAGFRIPAGAGTDAMANYAALHGPVGLNRVFVRVPAGPLKMEIWLENLRKGRTFATNGPLLDFTLNGKTIGDELALPAGKAEVKFSVALRSIVPLEHLQLVCNGEVAKEIPLTGDRTTADARGTIAVEKSGWCVLRAWNQNGTHPILDLYPYATTSPIYITIGGAPARSREDAAYFLAWVDRLIANAQANTAWNSPAEKEIVLKQLQEARAVWQARQK
jgi:hypothetical protein